MLYIKACRWKYRKYFLIFGPTSVVWFFLIFFWLSLVFIVRSTLFSASSAVCPCSLSVHYISSNTFKHYKIKHFVISNLRLFACLFFLIIHLCPAVVLVLECVSLFAFINISSSSFSSASLLQKPETFQSKYQNKRFVICPGALGSLGKELKHTMLCPRKFTIQLLFVDTVWITLDFFCVWENVDTVNTEA